MLTKLRGVNSEIADRLRKCFGVDDDETILKRLTLNPYDIMQFPGMGFQFADELAFQLGKSPDWHVRHLSGNTAILRQPAKLRNNEFLKRRSEYHLSPGSLTYYGTLRESGYVWLPSELVAERKLATYFASTLERSWQAGVSVNEFERIKNLNFTQEQLEAIDLSVRAPLSAVVGGAGTGKTLTAAGIVMAALERFKTIRAMTFTGQAANNLSQSLREHGLTPKQFANIIDISTVHHALGANGEYFTATKIVEDFVLIDEGATVPNVLLAAVISILSPTTQLVLLGDTGQLPPIGYGIPFEDFIAAGVPTARLTINHRQRLFPELAELASAIRDRAEKPPLRSVNTSFFFQYPVGNLGEPIDALRQAMQRYNVESPMHWQCICDINVTRTIVNQELQQYWNPHGQVVARGTDNDTPFEFRLDDKVVFTTSDLRLKIRNGMLGILVTVMQGNAYIVTESEPLTLPLAILPHIAKLGYAITSYKAQGSAWKVVLCFQTRAIPKSGNRFNYTSVTRCTNHYVFVTPLTRHAWWSNVVQEEANEPSSLLLRLQAISGQAA